MTQLYRPTLHQIHALHWHHLGQEATFTCIAAGLEHVAGALAPDAAEDLRAQLMPERRPQLHPRDARCSLVRSPDLYPVPGHPDRMTGPLARDEVRSPDLYPVPGHAPLRAAFFADQESTAILLHFIWHWDGEGDVATFQALRNRLWVSPLTGEPQTPEVSETSEVSQVWPAGDLGEGLLLTAALLDAAANDSALAHEIVAPFGPPETPLTRIPLNGATLYVHLQMRLHPVAWPAVLLFDRPEVEHTSAADQLATMHWPLVVLNHLRLERLYLDEYRRQVVPRLVEHGPALRQALKVAFAPGAHGNPEPRLLTRGDLGEMRRTLARLSGPQYNLLDALSAAERCAHDARRDVRNLEEALQAALAVPLTGARPAPEETEAAVATMSRRARHFVAQMETDASEAHNLAERAAQAVDVLRTQADILEAGYERGLNVTVAVLGLALAAGQLVSDDLAAWLWEQVVRPLWPPALAPLAAPVLERLLVRLLVMLVVGLATWLLIRLYGRLGQ